MRTPTLDGEMVSLRPVGFQDAAAIWALRNDPEVRRLTGTVGDVSLEQAEDWAGTVAGLDGRHDWAITVGGSDEMLGEAVLDGIDPAARAASLRTTLRPGHRGRGYTREATMLVTGFAFGAAPEGLGLHRVGLEVLGIDQRAFALYESLGFVTEGRLRDTHVDGGRYYDTIVMGMLEEEYAQARQAWR